MVCPRKYVLICIAFRKVTKVPDSFSFTLPFSPQSLFGKVYSVENNAKEVISCMNSLCWAVLTMETIELWLPEMRKAVLVSDLGSRFDAMHKKSPMYVSVQRDMIAY